MNDYYKGKSAFITGSSRGIGRATALELAKKGCNILLHYKKDQKAVDDTLVRVKGYGVEAKVYQADLCNIAQTQEMMEKIKDENESLDFFIANAASTAFKPLMDVSPDNVAKTFSLVVSSFILSVQNLRPLMSNRDAQIVTISGIDTEQYCPNHGLLAAAKSALETLSKYLSVELAGDKINVKCLNPGLVASDSTKFYFGDIYEDMLEKANTVAPHGGFATTEQVAQLISLLLRPEMNWLSAKTIKTDGGLSFLMPALT